MVSWAGPVQLSGLNLSSSAGGGCPSSAACDASPYAQFTAIWRRVVVSGVGGAQHVCGIVVRMSDSAVSVAARQLSGSRWGAQRPVRLARELAERVDELPDPERVRLLNA